MAVGKSTVGALLARSEALDFVDLDQEIGNIPKIFQQEGEAGFRLRERETLLQVLGRARGEPPQRGYVLSLGGGTLDAPENRAALAEWTVVVLMARPDALLERLGEGQGRPLAGEMAERLTRRLPIWSSYGAFVWTDGLEPAEVADQVRARLAG